MPKILLPVATIFALGACATVPAERYDLTRATVDRIAETENAFAARFQESRFQSFVDFAAESAVTAGDQGYESAKAAYAELAARPAPPNPPKLEWWPEHVEASCAGDIGWSTGPVLRTRGEQVGHAHYFTIWERQADGTYKWFFDRGVNHGAPEKSFPRGTPPESNDRSYCAEAGAREQSGSFAMAEAKLRAGLAADAAAAYRAALGPTGRISRENALPETGAKGISLAAAGPAERVESEAGSRVAASGDMAYSYGRATWTDGEGKAHSGDYVRVWRDEGAGWKIVFDQLNEAQG